MTVANHSPHLSERDLSQCVVDAAQQFGWKVARWPTWQRTGTYAGVPDLELARRGVVLLVELKTDKGELDPDQVEWQYHAGAHHRVWRPADWWSGAIDEVLR